MGQLAKPSPLAPLLTKSAKSDTPLGDASCQSLKAWRGWERQPLPQELDGPALDRIENMLVQALRPATPHEIATSIELLRARFGEWSKPSASVLDALNREWVEDLADVPAHLLAEACRRWRSADDPPNKRPPQTAGEITALIRDDWSRLKFLAHQVLAARKALAARAG